MKRFAWILAILGFLCAVYVVLANQVTGKWDTISGVVGGAGILLLVAWAWLDRQLLEATARSRAVWYGSGATLIVMMCIGLAVAANVLAFRYDKRWDATKNKQFTLAEQSVKIVSALSTDVQVVAFFPSGSPEESSFRDLADGYKEHSSRLKVEFHDPLREPVLAQEFEITNDVGTVVLTAGKDKQRLESTFNEEALTNAIIRVSTGVRHEICFSQDHGEPDPDEDQDPASFGFAVQKLEGQNYSVRKISILKDGGIPKTCEVFILAAPQVDLLAGEHEALARHVVDGGAAFIMLEPLVADATAADLSRYGVRIGRDLVVEDNPQARQYGLDPSFLIVGGDQLDFHPITNDLKAGVLLQLARSVDKQAETPQGLNVQVLAHSSDLAWAETSIEGNIEAKPDEGVDIVGKVPLMVAVEIVDPKAVPVNDVAIGPANPSRLPITLAGSTDADKAASTAEADRADKADEGKKRMGRLVVVGDASFAGNQLFAQGMNQDLFLNTVAWLVGEEDQVSIRPNEAAKGSLQMSLGQGVIVWFLALLGVPGLALAGAIANWLMRRKM